MLIEIPTRKRPDWLYATVCQVGLMKAPGDKIIVVGSPGSTDSRSMTAIALADALYVPVPDSTPLPEKHQLAYQYALDEQIEHVMILHDDFMFGASFFLDALLEHCQDLVGAVAGVYPFVGQSSNLASLPSNYDELTVFSGGIHTANNWHQVYLYPDDAPPLRTEGIEHLFGPFMYQVQAMKDLGGFPVGRYSRVSHREETDVTYRIKQVGWDLGVATRIIGYHFMTPQGGAAEDRFKFLQSDEEAFQQNVLNQGSEG